VPSQAQH